jgi:hypothetical protein
MEELKRGLFDIELAKMLKLYEHNINIYEIIEREFAPIDFPNYSYEDLDTSLGYYSIEFSIFKETYYNLKRKEKKKLKQLTPTPDNITFLILQINPFIKKHYLLP